VQATRPAPPAGRIKLVAAARRGNVGDQGQAASIVAALERQLAQADTTTAARISRERIELHDMHQTSSWEQLAAAYDKLATALRNGDYDYVVLVVAGSGDQLAPSLGSMPHQDGLITVFSGHQLTDDIRKADKLPMYTALPGYDVTARQKTKLDARTTLILVQGVAHSLSVEKLAETVQQYHAKGYEPLPPVDADSVGIVLGGDAPDAKGQLCLFTARDARRLARRIAELELAGGRQAHFIVLNGPRTGKFRANGKERIPDPHASGQIDPVTRAFVRALGRFHGSRVTLLDFQRGKLPSAYAPLIDAFLHAGQNRGRLHVPGDSISMISEATSLLADVIIDDIPSMNPSHHRYAVQVMTVSGGTRLTTEGGLRTGPRRAPGAPVAADEQIAQAVVAGLCKPPPPAAPYGPAAGDAPASRHA
jgi:hypothetical protein